MIYFFVIFSSGGAAGDATSGGAAGGAKSGADFIACLPLPSPPAAAAAPPPPSAPARARALAALAALARQRRAAPQVDSAAPVPPASAGTAGTMAATDDISAPWFSPAGGRRGQYRGVTSLAYNATKSQRDTLYKAGVNPACLTAHVASIRELAVCDTPLASKATHAIPLV